MNKSEELSKLLGIEPVIFVDGEFQGKKSLLDFEKDFKYMETEEILPDFEEPENFVKLLDAIRNTGERGALVEFGDNNCRIQNFETHFTADLKYRDEGTTSIAIHEMLLDLLLDTNWISCTKKERNKFITLLKKQVQQSEFVYTA